MLPVRSSKIMVPRTGERIMERQSLLTRIAEALSDGHLWIASPPGFGKTMLAAGYAGQVEHVVAWYALDVLDADPVSFFATFSQSFSNLSRSASALPDLQPEDHLALPVFACKFFRCLFSTITQKWLLILDNIHEIPPDSPVVDLLVTCLQEVPLDCRVILLSRHLPPPCFARLQVEGKLHLIGAESLRFSRPEIGQLMALHGMATEQEHCIEYLDKTTKGWVAGLTLLLKDYSSAPCPKDTADQQDNQALFNYFAGVIFAGFAEEERMLLMTAALLPVIRPDLLDNLRGEDTAGEYFLRLCRENFFTYSLDEEKTLFQFHPLFKDFLRRQANESLSAELRQGLLERAADFFLEEESVPEAIDLLILAESWPHAIRSILKIGAIMLEQGRFRTLLYWRNALPEQIIEREPWLLYYFGVATMSFAPAEAMSILKTDFLLFQEQNETTGALLACCSLTNATINQLSDLALLDPWLDFLEEQLNPRTFVNDGSFAQNIIADSVMRALVLRRPAHPDLDLWLEHVRRRGGLHPALITHYLWTGRFPEARAALDNVYAHQDQIRSKLLMSAIMAMELQYHLIMGEPDQCRRVIDEAVQLVRESGIRVWEVHFYILGAGCCLNCGRKKEAEQYLRLMEENISRARLLERSYYHVIKTFAALLDDDLVSADHQQRSALEMAEKIGMPSYTTWCWYNSALVAVFQGNMDEARARCAQIFRPTAASKNPWFICQAHLALGYGLLVHGERQAAMNHLRDGFSLARQNNYQSFFFFVPKMMEAIAICALEEKIEQEFVRRFIRRRQLMPAHPPTHLDAWPWPLKIYTLGRFSLLRHDKPLDESVVAGNKPIQLLQTMIAHRGRQVSKTLLADILWPDSEGDEQAASLKITLHRLRKLLGVPGAIIQTTSHLTLDPRFCWVDSWRFERLAGKALRAGERNDPGYKSAISKALACYRGDFMASCRDESWIMEHRCRLQKLKQRLQRLLDA